MPSLSLKNFAYLTIIIISYFIGDSEIPEIAYEKIVGKRAVGQAKEVLVYPRNYLSENIYPLGKFEVTNVIDGDTLKVKNELGVTDTVRFLAVNTMEMDSTNLQEKCFAKFQTNFTKENLFKTIVYLYGDKSQTERDKYGRILAYVATSTEHKNYFFNSVLLETGNADIYKASPPATMYDSYKLIVNNSKTQKIGMWSNVCN